MKYLILFLLSYNVLHCQIQLLNDEFNDSMTLAANWLNINDVEQWGAEQLELLDIDQSSPGQMMMMPWTSSWFEDYKGTLIFKEVAQDFVITTSVSATNQAGNDMPGPNYSLAGIMLRTPRDYPNGATGAGGWTPNGENYVFLSAGFAATNHPSCSGCAGPHFEVKNTINGTSVLSVSSINDYEDVLIRVARVDTVILVLNQLPGGSWEVHQRYNRTDFPDTLQVGFVCYTDWQKVSTYEPYFHNSHVLNDTLDPDPSSNPALPFSPDLIGNFAYARFDSVDVPVELANVDLFSEATDGEILSFLGYDTEPYCPDNVYVQDTIVSNQIALMEAVNEITSDQGIAANGNMTYHAGDAVELLPGFTLDAGALLQIEMTGCTQ